jgi:hypothetical protein
MQCNLHENRAEMNRAVILARVFNFQRLDVTEPLYLVALLTKRKDGSRMLTTY